MTKNINKKNRLFMLVDRPPYELPLIVADTLEELAAEVGQPACSIKRQIMSARKAHKWCKYVMVDLDDEE